MQLGWWWSLWAMSVGLRCAGRTLWPGRRESAAGLMSGRRWSPAPRLCVTRSRGEVRSRGRAVSVFARQRRGWSRGAPFRALTRRKETLLTLRPLDMHMQPIGERSCKCSPTKGPGCDRHRIDGSKMAEICVQRGRGYQECCAVSTRRVDGEGHLSDGPAARPQRDRRKWGQYWFQRFRACSVFSQARL